MDKASKRQAATHVAPRSAIFSDYKFHSVTATGAIFPALEYMKVLVGRQNGGGAGRGVSQLLQLAVSRKAASWPGASELMRVALTYLT